MIQQIQRVLLEHLTLYRASEESVLNRLGGSSRTGKFRTLVFETVADRSCVDLRD